MASWNPDEVRNEYNLFLTDGEKAAIQAKLPPAEGQPPGVFFADGVFEGGGVLGIAFLGAARCCADLGIRWRGLAGTSAGAITAALLASDHPIDRLEQILGSLDFNAFLSQKTSRLIFNGDPSNDLEDPITMILNLKVARQLGEYSTDPFKKWIEDALGSGGIVKFSDVSRNDPERKLKVVISDLSRGEMRVLPEGKEDVPSDFPVAEAVRLSMSIPFFFAPGQLGDSVIVDGGILSNFPLWIYDEPNPMKEPAWPTFGFRLMDRREQETAKIGSVTDILKSMISTMMYASDKHYLSERNEGRVIDLDITDAGVKVTQFNLTDNQKIGLYRIGYEYTRDFFLNQWSWEKHLEARGFPKTPQSAPQDGAVAALR